MAISRPRQLLRVDPLSVMAQLDRDFDDLVRRTWSGPTSSGARSGVVPPVDIVRDGPDVLLRLEVPGVDPERDLSLEVEQGRLVVAGERPDPWAEAGEGMLVREIRHGAFRREFALPDGVDAERVEADYDAGVLTVRLVGVAAPPPEPRRITVNVGRRPQVLENSAPEKGEAPAEPEPEPAGQDAGA